MKKIFTAFVTICMMYGIGHTQQVDIRLIEINPTRIATQYRIDPGVVPTPGAGSGFNACFPLVTDALFSDLTHAIIWDNSAPIASIAVANLLENEADCNTGSNNNPPCFCFTADCSESVGHGLVIASSNNNGGVEYRTLGNLDGCNNMFGAWNSVFDWQFGVWYTVVTIDVNWVGAPTGSPLDHLSIDADGSVSGQAPNLGVQVNNAPIPPAGYPATVQPEVPLPLNLLSFEAKKEGDKSAFLTWTTANEVNTKIFVVQRSSDRESWNDIGSVEASVNNSGIKQYNFMDKNVYSERSNREVYYYRLKMIDQDNSFKHSNIDVVSFSAFLNNQDGFKLYLYPNPATDGVNVEIAQPEDGYQITNLQLFDVSGKMVYNRDIAPGSEIEYIDFADLNVSSGTYILRATDAVNVPQAHEKVVVLR